MNGKKEIHEIYLDLDFSNEIHLEDGFLRGEIRFWIGSLHDLIMRPTFGKYKNSLLVKNFVSALS